MEKDKYLNGISPKPYLDSKEYDFKKRYDSLLMIAKAICPMFELTNENKSIYENGIRYFSGDISGKFNLNKGLYIYGKIGSGKTLFFKIMKQLNKATKTGNNFKTVTVSNLIDGFSKKGFEYFTNFNPDPWMMIDPHVLLDDLGQSATSVKHFGSVTDVVSEFIQRRYYVYTECFKLTHISTNMEPAEIKNEYGEFISSRMREMFNIILFPGTDKRK